MTGGLWSINRGLARKQERYDEMLGVAGMPRQGDIDGRGNLSEGGLRRWCEFFIELAHDQVTFMGKLLALDGLRERIETLVLVRSESSGYSNYPRQAALALSHVLLAGPTTRGDFTAMLGLSARTASRVLAQLLKDRSLASAVTFAFPLDALHLLLPNLYPEASALDIDS